MTELWQNPIVKGAIAGVVASAAVDFQAFRAFKSLNDFESYSWGIAAFRWVQGAVLGAVTALGLSF